jgi:hypothetical protein
MSESNYTIKEFISHSMSDIKETINAIHEDVKSIKEQTIKTNGRVTRLEYWRNAIAWSFGVLMTIVLFTINYFK